MRAFAQFTVFAACGLLSCRGAAPSPQPVITPPTISPNGAWQLRLQLDSSPSSRSPQTRTIDGTVAGDFTSYRLDFRPLLGHALAARISFQMINGGELPIEITLGELSSDHEIVTLRGRMVGRDSIVGTWEEILYCCGARGRFVLWRPRE